MVILDDGALRFLDRHGDAVDHLLPGCMQPPGDCAQIPKGTFVDCWRGDRMDLGVAVDVMIQESRKA